MSKLTQPLSIKNLTLRNRIGMPPMCQYSAENGFSNDWHVMHYGTRAVGGVGLIIVEATGVTPEGRITPRDLGIWSDEHIPELKRVAGIIKQHGAVAAIQLGHAGRKASHAAPADGGHQLIECNGGWSTVAPSPTPFEPGDISPVELNKAGIKQIIGSFRDAAARSLEAGFDIVEIHGAHGYLIHEFLSPLSNQRTDEYGGSFENRIRFLLEIVESIQSVWPATSPLFVRLSATDWAEGGWNVEETVALCSILHKKGVDLIDCSSGGNIYNACIPLSAGYQVSFAEAVHQTGILTSAVGLITSAAEINDILEQQKADIVLLGRELLRNPYFALTATLNDENPVQWPIQYLRGKR